MTMMHRALAVAATPVDGTRQVRVVCSTDAVDRYGDIVVQAGIDLAAFRSLKTVLWNHDQDEPIAKCISIDLVGDHLEALVEFPDEGINPKSDQIYGLIKAGIVNAVSIGFGVKKSVPIDKARPKAGSTIEQSDLWELSFVSVPANPEAVIVERAAPRRRPSATRSTPMKPKVKGLYEVARLADALYNLGWIEEYVEWEAEDEGDGSEVPAKLNAALVALGHVLVEMTVEEVAEMIRVETDEASTKAAGSAFARKMASWPPNRARYVLKSAAPLTNEAASRLKSAWDGFLNDQSNRSMVLESNITVQELSADGRLTTIDPVAIRSGKAFSTKNAETIASACKAIKSAHDDIMALIDDAEASADDPEADAEAEAKSIAARTRRVRIARAAELGAPD